MRLERGRDTVQSRERFCILTTPRHNSGEFNLHAIPMRNHPVSLSRIVSGKSSSVDGDSNRLFRHEKSLRHEKIQNGGNSPTLHSGMKKAGEHMLTGFQIFNVFSS
jgi:hypothetical protein